MFWIHPETQSRDIPNPLNGVYNPTGAPDVLIAAGWRMAEEAPPVAEGYERLYAPRWEQSPSDPYSAVCVAVDSLIQDRLDRETASAAQAELDRQAAEQAAQAAHMALLTPEFMQRAYVFRLTLRRNFGDNAETNQAVTEESAAAYFVGKQAAGTITAQEIADLIVLKEFFPLLSAWTGDGTTWSFPWELLPA